MADRVIVNGSLCNDKGTWVVRAYVIDPVTGKKKHRSKSTGLKVAGNNTRKANGKLREIISQWEAEANGAITVTDEGVTFEEYVQEWLETKVYTLSAGTYHTYDCYATSHIIPMLGKIEMRKLNRRHVQNYVNEMSKTLTARTIKKHMAVINGVVHAAFVDGVVSGDVAYSIRTVEIPKERSRFEGTTLSEEQVGELLRAAVQKGEPTMCAVVLGVCYGLRRSEICGLRWCDVDFENGVLHVRNTVTDVSGRVVEVETTKTKASKRDIPLIEATVPYLKELHDSQASQGFDMDKLCSYKGRGAKPDHVSSRVISLLKELGFEGVRLHDLRHTAASLLARRLAPKQVQAFMGHEDISTTLNIYTHILDEDKIETSRVMGTILNGALFPPEKVSGNSSGMEENAS